MGILAPKRYIIKPSLGVRPQSSHSIGNGLLALFPFTEAGGAPLYLPQQAPGVLSGVTPPTWTEGDGGAGLLFGGTGNLNASYVDFSTDPYLQDLFLGPVSWFWRFQMTTSGGLASRGNGSTTGWNIGIGSGGGWTMRSPTSSGASFLASGSTVLVNTGTGWFNLVVTYDGNNSSSSCTAYINGLLDNGVTATPAGSGTFTTDAASHFEIGQVSVGSGELNFGMLGTMTLMAVWKRVLSPAEGIEVTFNENLLFERTRSVLLANLGTAANLQPYNWIIP